MKSVIKLTIAALAMFTIVSCNTNGGFKKIGGGIEYKILKAGSGKETAKLGDVLLVDIINLTDNDSVIMDTHKGMQGSEPHPFQIPIREAKSKFDLMGWLLLLKKGDSAVFVLPTDSIFPDAAARPAFIKAHSKVKSILIVKDLMSSADAQKKQMEAQQKQMEAGKMQAVKDEEIIQSYIKEKGLKDVKKTENGVYYIITKKGVGPNVENGKKVTMNYSGYLLNGKMFDSNIDASKGHVEPFKFVLGARQVIQGWDAGVAMLNKGAKAKFIVPSGLAYGPQAMGAEIAPNSVLVFDVELVGWE